MPRCLPAVIQARAPSLYKALLPRWETLSNKPDDRISSHTSTGGRLFGKATSDCRVSDFFDWQASGSLSVMQNQSSSTGMQKQEKKRRIETSVEITVEYLKQSANLLCMESQYLAFLKPRCIINKWKQIWTWQDHKRGARGRRKAATKAPPRSCRPSKRMWHG